MLWGLLWFSQGSSGGASRPPTVVSPAPVIEDILRRGASFTIHHDREMPLVPPMVSLPLSSPGRGAVGTPVSWPAAPAAPPAPPPPSPLSPLPVMSSPPSTQLLGSHRLKLVLRLGRACRSRTDEDCQLGHGKPLPSAHRQQTLREEPVDDRSEDQKQAGWRYRDMKRFGRNWVQAARQAESDPRAAWPRRFRQVLLTDRYEPPSDRVKPKTIAHEGEGGSNVSLLLFQFRAASWTIMTPMCPAAARCIAEQAFATPTDQSRHSISDEIPVFTWF